MIKPYLPRWWIIGISIVLLTGQTLLSLVVPLITMSLVNTMVEANFQVNTILLLLTVFLSQIVLSGVSLYMLIYTGQKIVAGLREELWSRVLRLPVNFFDEYTSGETMSRITNDTNVIKQFFTDQLIPFFSGMITIIGSILLLIYLDWVMALVLFLIVPTSYIIFGPLGKRMFRISKVLQDETAEFQGDLGRVLTDIRLVKSSLAEKNEIYQGKSRISKLFAYGLREGKIIAIATPIMTTITLSCLVIVFGYGGIQVAKGALTAGTLVAIVFYIFQIISPLSQLAQFFTQFQKTLGASERIRVIMDETPESSVYNLDDTSTTEDGLVFQNVHFSYKEKIVLDDVSLIAPKGRVTALVGPSGAGKTTIFSLIERFYHPNMGNIFYKRRSIDSHGIDEWRSMFAYVSQDSPMMAGNIRYNLTYGLDQVEQEVIDNAVEQANLTEFIASLPDGYETQVGERGIRLSGGQRQRIAIARAIIRDPEVLLLDEATAHLDSASEQYVQTAMQQLMKDRTTLIIAHRLSTVKNAHQIIVIESGRVTGTGTHSELYMQNNLYQSLVNQQNLQYS
ncbi:ABC transporter ATP-binding protein [Viridibacillus sp. NPDC096237]|uniref:ABC transporter ATP-binding protein n=1 Tax=Viridibacillus sp. NPDC096237 TaxID=3390721 RepID=UPI003CFCDBEF